MKWKTADLNLIGVNFKKKITVCFSQSYLIVKEIITLTQRFSFNTISHHTRTMLEENSGLKAYFYGNVFVLG